MDETAKRNVEKAIALFGPGFVLSYFFFWGILGHNIPPPNVVGMSAEQLVTDYYGKYPEITLAMIVSAMCGMFYMPWSCLLASMLKERDGSVGVLSMMELSGGILTSWVLAFCPAIWCVCAMMAGTADPVVIKSLHLLGWLFFDCTWGITGTQLLGLGLYVIMNRQQSIFPAWTGWCALATGATFIPLTIIPFVTDGPFTVSGMWNYYIVFGTWFFLFFCVFSYYMLKHLHGAKGDQRVSNLGVSAS